MNSQSEVLRRKKVSAARFLTSLALCAVALTSLQLNAGCRRQADNEASSPEAAFTRFAAAMDPERGDRESLWAFLGPDTRAELQRRAAEGERLGITGMSPVDYLHPSWTPSEADIESVERAGSEGDTVTLRVRTYVGDESEVMMVRGGDGWKVELPFEHPGTAGE